MTVDGVPNVRVCTAVSYTHLDVYKRQAPVGDGTYRYTIPADRSIEDINKRVRRIFREVAISIEDSENIIVIKTLEGAAQAVACLLYTSRCV